MKASADRHLKDASLHRAGAGGPKAVHDNIISHCEKTAADLRAAADESDSLAKAYRELAGKKQ